MSFNEWKEVRLEEVVDVLGDGLHGTPKYDENGEYYFINGNNLLGKISIDEKTKRVSYEEYLKHKKPLNDRTILISINGTLGNVATYNDEQVMLGKSACYFNVSTNYDKDFIKYVMHSDNFKHYINTYSTGTTIKNMGLKQMRAFTFSVPSLQEQKVLANILSSLDEKIELNNQMNKTLEEMAQALFKRWFVDFEFPNEEGEPYKSSGGEMVDSELGMIPKGWESIKLGDSDIEIEDGDRGKNYPNKAQLQPQGDVAFLNNKNIVGDKINFIETEYINRERDLLLRKGKIKINDIILTTRGSVGNIGLFHKFLPCEEARINSGMVIIRNKEMFNLYFLYQQLKDKTLKEQYKKMATGSAQPQLPIKDIKKLTLLIPKEHIQEKFEMVVKGLYKTIFKNDKENYSLINVRNNLLPKLMSGELRVTDLQN